MITNIIVSKECINCSHPYDCKKCKICEQFMKEYTLEDLLLCPMCGTSWEKVDEYTYKPNCKCYKKEIRMSVG